MKYAFIVNPASGQGKHGNGLVPQIEQLIADNPDRDIKIYYTSGTKDATVVADCIARETEGEVVIFACGGDGTIQEVVNGVYGHDNAYLSVIPIGSGNDFARALGGGLKEGKKYLNLTNHLDANSMKIDLIRMTWEENGEEKTVLVDNGINIGFDGNTCLVAADYKKLPGVSGTGAYVLAVAKTLIKKDGTDLHITVDGEEFFNGPHLLTTIGNGGFCGGGFESCPKADLTDGMLEVLTINDMTRVNFVSLVPKYKGGKIFDVANKNNRIFKYTQAKEIIIEPNGAETMKFVADGEFYETGKLKIEVVPDAINVLAL